MHCEYKVTIDLLSISYHKCYRSLLYNLKNTVYSPTYMRIIMIIYVCNYLKQFKGRFKKRPSSETMLKSLERVVKISEIYFLTNS